MSRWPELWEIREKNWLLCRMWSCQIACSRNAMSFRGWQTLSHQLSTGGHRSCFYRGTCMTKLPRFVLWFAFFEIVLWSGRRVCQLVSSWHATIFNFTVNWHESWDYCIFYFMTDSRFVWIMKVAEQSSPWRMTLAFGSRSILSWSLGNPKVREQLF